MTPTCTACGAVLSQLTIYEKGTVKSYSCWCANRDCRAFVEMTDSPLTEVSAETMSILQ